MIRATPRSLLLPFFLASCLAPRPLWAHVEPIYPVNVVLKVYPDQAIAHIEVPASFWKNNILGGDIPPSNWPATLDQKAEDYIASHLKFQVDGSTLQARLIASRFVEEPWGSLDGGQLLFDVSYPMAPGSGGVLSGRSAFYDSHYKPAAQRPEGIEQDFVTYLEVPGGQDTRLTVPFEQPDFQIALPPARRTFWQRCAENARAGAAYPISEPGLLVFLAAAVLFLPAGRTVAKTLPWCAALALAVFFTGPAAPGRFLSAGFWLLTIPLAAAAGALLDGRFWSAAALVCALGFGLGAHAAAAAPVLASPPLPERLCFLTGAGAVLAAAAGLCLAALALYRRSLLRQSESQGDSLFLQHARFAGSFLAVVSLYQLIQTLRS